MRVIFTGNLMGTARALAWIVLMLVVGCSALVHHVDPKVQAERAKWAAFKQELALGPTSSNQLSWNNETVEMDRAAGVSVKCSKYSGSKSVKFVDFWLKFCPSGTVFGTGYCEAGGYKTFLKHVGYKSSSASWTCYALDADDTVPSKKFNLVYSLLCCK